MKNLSLILALVLTFGFQLLGWTQQATGPERWETTIQGFEANDQANPPQDSILLFTGSSSIVMYKDLAQHFEGYPVLNRGFGGSQFSDLLHYAPRVIFAYKPSKIFIYEGDNDIATGDKPKAVFKEAKKLRKQIAKALPGVPVIFIAAKPSVSRWHIKDQYVDFNQRLKKWSDKTKDTYFADVWTAMLDEKGEVYPHLFIEDKLHMNEQGYQIWKEVLTPFVENTLKD